LLNQRFLSFSLGHVSNVFIAQYDAAAGRYHADVYIRKRMRLASAIASTASPLFLAQRKNLRQACLSSFKQDVQKGMGRGEATFEKVVRNVLESYETRFMMEAHDALVVEGEDGVGTGVGVALWTHAKEKEPESILSVAWAWKEELKELRSKLRPIEDQLSKDYVETRSAWWFWPVSMDWVAHRSEAKTAKASRDCWCRRFKSSERKLKRE